MKSRRHRLLRTLAFIFVAASFVTIAAGNAIADTFSYSYSYTFTDGNVVSGSLNGSPTQVATFFGSDLTYVTEIVDVTDVTLFFNGAQLNEVFDVTEPNAAPAYEVSFDGRHNNFLFAWTDSVDPTTMAYFWMNTETLLGYEHVAGFHAMGGVTLFDSVEDSLMHLGDANVTNLTGWTFELVQPIDTPENSTAVELGIGLMGLMGLRWVSRQAEVV